MEIPPFSPLSPTGPPSEPSKGGEVGHVLPKKAGSSSEVEGIQSKMAEARFGGPATPELVRSLARPLT